MKNHSVAGLLIGLLCASGVWAESAPEEDSEYSRVLEEVIVTARKMGEERMLDVSMSGSVLTSELIDRRFLVGMDD